MPPTAVTDRSAVETKDLPPIGLPREAYVDSEWLENEFDRIFGRRWLYAGHISELADAGDFIRFDFGDSSVLITRDQNEALSAMHNVCRHRGARLVEESRGKCKSFVCPYHGWAYGLDGQLRAAPRMHEGVEKSDYPLKRVSVDTWNGLVFVNLQTDPPETLAAALSGADFSAYQLDRARLAWDTEHEVEANWKILWENGLECYHCAINHPELRQVVEVIRNGPQPSHIDAGEFDFRPEYPVLGRTVTIDGEYASKRLMGDPDSPPDTVSFLQWHTSMFEVIAAPDYTHMMIYRPVSPTRTAVRMVGLVHEDAVEDVDYVTKDLMELSAVTRAQDDGLCERVQRGVASPAFEPGPYNRGYEFMLQNFVRVYLDALAE